MPVISETARLIMEIYRDCRVRQDEHLSMRALIMTKITWRRDHQDDFVMALEELIEKGFLAKGKTGLTLTMTGQDFLYPEPSEEKGKVSSPSFSQRPPPPSRFQGKA